MKMGRIRHLALPFLLIAIVTGLVLSSALETRAQCTPSQDGNSGVKFVNESSHKLTFFLDDDEKVVLKPGTTSTVYKVDPGEHIFRARAMVAGVAFWVHAGNEVPKGNTCTWTVDDPSKRSASPGPGTSPLRRRMSGGNPMNIKGERKWK